MIVKVDETGTVEGFAGLLEDVGGSPGVRGVLAMACAANGFVPETVAPLLAAVPVPLLGGVFPGVVAQGACLERGAVVVGLTSSLEVHTVAGLSSRTTDFDQCLDVLPPGNGADSTLLVIVDGNSSRIADFVESLFVVHGLEFNYLGGGAGYLEHTGRSDRPPCLFTNQGMVGDAALLGLLDAPCGVGVKHGWKWVDGPLTVTETRGNQVLSLDWRPAFATYSEAVNRHAASPMDREGFQRTAQSFPFGLGKLGMEHVVRDVLGLEGDALVFGAAIPDEAFVDVLHGDHDTLVEAAAWAYDQARAGLGPGQEASGLLLMDCITRRLFMGDQFVDELAALNRDGLPMAGALTLGEIANSGTDYLEFFNKTCVVGMVKD